MNLLKEDLTEKFNHSLEQLKQLGLQAHVDMTKVNIKAIIRMHGILFFRY